MLNSAIYASFSTEIIGNWTLFKFCQGSPILSDKISNIFFSCLSNISQSVTFRSVLFVHLFLWLNVFNYVWQRMQITCGHLQFRLHLSIRIRTVHLSVCVPFFNEPAPGLLSSSHNMLCTCTLFCSAHNVPWLFLSTLQVNNQARKRTISHITLWSIFS